MNEKVLGYAKDYTMQENVPTMAELEEEERKAKAATKDKKKKSLDPKNMAIQPLDFTLVKVSELFKTTGGDFSAGFHTYGVEWNAGELIFYIDGTEYQRFTSENVASQDMYLIINLAVGGWFVGSPEESTQFPAEMQIDHVRVYEQIEQ